MSLAIDSLVGLSGSSMVTHLCAAVREYRVQIVAREPEPPPGTLLYAPRRPATVFVSPDEIEMIG